VPYCSLLESTSLPSIACAVSGGRHALLFKDYVSRDLFEKLMADEEHHIDFWKRDLI
jgi:hypothetical protein